jgi:hypothetical protein
MYYTAATAGRVPTGADDVSPDMGGGWDCLWSNPSRDGVCLTIDTAKWVIGLIVCKPKARFIGLGNTILIVLLGLGCKRTCAPVTRRFL